MDDAPDLGSSKRRQQLVRLIKDPARYLDSPDANLRRLAVASLEHGHAAAHGQLLGMIRDDPDTAVRAAAAEAIAGYGDEHDVQPLIAAADGAEPVVVEAVAFALGEIGHPSALDWLLDVAQSEQDRSSREAAVASLGAIGDRRALSVLLGLVRTGPPQVRRRCVVALTAFEGPEVHAAFEEAAHDRNPMVREAAEMVIGRRRDATTEVSLGTPRRLER